MKDQPIVMTRREYNESNIKGWHEVCHDYDGCGGTAVRYGLEAIKNLLGVKIIEKPKKGGAE